MGWDGVFKAGRSDGEIIKVELARLFGAGIVAKSSYGSREIYVAARDKDSNVVRGYVVLVNRAKSELLFKVINEVEGPYYYNASSRVIRALSPSEDRNALVWRSACVEKRKRVNAVNRVKLAPLSVVVFKDPVKLSSGPVGFGIWHPEYGRHGCFFSSGGVPFRYPGWRLNVSEVIPYPGNPEAFGALVAKLVLKFRVSGSGSPAIEGGVKS